MNTIANIIDTIMDAIVTALGTLPGGVAALVMFAAVAAAYLLYEYAKAAAAYLLYEYAKDRIAGKPNRVRTPRTVASHPHF